MNTQRLEWIDMLKGFGIFLVFLGHTTLTNKTVDHYIYSFHIPLFFCISGLFYKGADTGGSIRKFLVKELDARMVPYVSFGLLTYSIWLFPLLLRKYGIYQGLHAVPDSLFFKPLAGMLYGIGDSDWLPYNSIMWFLACLFVTEIIFFVINALAKTKQSVLLILCAFAILGYIDSVYTRTRLPFSIDVAFTAVVFYGLGYLMRDYLHRFDLGISSAFVALIFGLGTGFLNTRVDMNYHIYGNPLLFYASSLASIYAYISFAKRIPNIRVMSYVGKNSLTFFLVQDLGFLVVNILAYLLFRARPNSMEPNLVYACCYVLLSILVLFPAVYVINSKVSFMTGRSRGNRKQAQVPEVHIISKV